MGDVESVVDLGCRNERICRCMAADVVPAQSAQMEEAAGHFEAVLSPDRCSQEDSPEGVGHKGISVEDVAVDHWLGDHPPMAGGIHDLLNLVDCAIHAVHVGLVGHLEIERTKIAHLKETLQYGQREYCENYFPCVHGG